MHLSSSMSSSETALMRSHLAAISPQLVPMLQQCVRTLSATFPQADRLFPLATKRQRYDAACVVSHVAKNIADPDAIRDWLKSMGTHLAMHGFTVNDCCAAKQSLLNAVRDHSGSSWTPELERVFRGAFEQVCDMVSSGMPAATVRNTLRLAA